MDSEIPSEFYLPRTRSYLLLVSMGLPVLEGCLVFSKDAATLEAARRMMASERVLVRSDPLYRDSPSIRGGDVWPMKSLEECAAKYIPLGRVLMLFEPYERTANRWSFSLLVDQSRREWWLEVVGAGFDSGHLNRGTASPHERYSGILNGSLLEIQQHSDFDWPTYFDDRAALPVTAVSDAEVFPEATLRAVLQAGQSLLGHHRVASIFVLSGAVLMPGRRLTYWDVFDPHQANR